MVMPTTKNNIEPKSTSGYQAVKVGLENTRISRYLAMAKVTREIDEEVQV